jgi:hypothetical protein
VKVRWLIIALLVASCFVARHDFPLGMRRSVADRDTDPGEASSDRRIEEAQGDSREDWLEDPIRWDSRIHPEDRRPPVPTRGATVTAVTLSGAAPATTGA